MSLTYATYVTSLANLLVVPESDSGFQTVLPNIIDDAELRMYRDLDPLDTLNLMVDTMSVSARIQRISDLNDPTDPPTTANNQPPVVIKAINVLTPLGATSDTATNRYPLVPATMEMVQGLWPSAAGSTIPQYFAVVAQNRFIVGPWPDQAYNFETYATVRFDPLSAANQTTLFSLYWPDMLIAASMVFAAGYQKNFGAAVDDPKMGPTWESHYQTLLSGASKEEDRKRLTERAITQAIPPAPTPRV